MVDIRQRSLRPVSHFSLPRILAFAAGVTVILGFVASDAASTLRAEEEAPQPVPPPRTVSGAPSALSAPLLPAPAVQASSPQQVSPPFAANPQPAPMNSIQDRLSLNLNSQRFQFKIEPNTPLKELLPIAPRIKTPIGPILAPDLAQVPEVEFQGTPARTPAVPTATRDVAYLIARINHLNDRRPEGFLEALRAQRPDLTGLPFAMGEECRKTGELSKQFAIAVATVRRALPQAPTAQSGIAVQVFAPPPPVTAPSSVRPGSTAFWEAYQAACSEEDKVSPASDAASRETVILARIAALSQILMPQTAELRLGLVKFLSGVAHAEATRALARLAIFSPEEAVRHAAMDALKVRRERDYTEVLVDGLRYPWPEVARRAADAAVRLDRKDLVPRLVDLLDQPDPRAPLAVEEGNTKALRVREMVRINHHRSCLLCHAPGNTGKVSGESLTAQVPVQGEPLPSPSDGYRTTMPDLLVRVDMTYLRQDFSMLQPVADAAPWPEMQRFDYLVRTRAVTDSEAAVYRARLARKKRGEVSPYQRAILAALRELTGRDTAPTSEAWRQLLELPTREQPVTTAAR